eukprot:TRINITY_DN412_c0_g1_i3.p1 TRINITY_DN412_c0_g1~~TRINITY_DN412_c0_g1_i3.p1  ORF type:complete len:530 (+),score=217.17 TRINITY_DN412_c0_g1_i3:59-1648(+)
MQMLLPFLAAAALGSSEYPVQFGVHIIDSWDGTRLMANSYVPVNTTGRLPLVIFINSWGAPSEEYIAPVNRFAKQGYVGLEYEARGFYGSGGQIGTAGPDDVQDVQAVITWALKKWPQADPNNIALGGISYGAGLSLLGAGADTRVKTVIAMSGWKNLVDALWWQTAPSLVWSDILLEIGKTTGRVPPILYEMLYNLMHYTNVSYTIDWANQRSPDKYLAELNNRKVPIFISNNMEDNLFHANFQLDFFEQLQGPKRLFMNQGTHAEAELSGLIPGDDNNAIWDAADAWLDHFLKGVVNNIQLPPLVRFTLGNKEVVMEHELFDTWPPSSGYEVLAYRLNSRGSEQFGLLDPSSTRTTPDTIAFTNHTEMTCGIPVVSPVLEPVDPIKCKLDDLNPQYEIAFLTEKFTRKTRVCGNIELENLVVTANAERFQVFGYIYTYNHGLLGHKGTLVAHTPAGVWANATAGQPYTFGTLEFRTACVDVKEGHQLALGINLKNLLYKDANSEASLNVTIDYTNGAPLLKVPTVKK